MKKLYLFTLVAMLLAMQTSFGQKSKMQISKSSPPSPSLGIEGNVVAEPSGTDLPDVRMTLQSSVHNPSYFTTSSGYYVLKAIPGYQHDLYGSKTGDVDCGGGVSTFDILLIRQHILLATSFTEAWQWIAADATSDDYVSTYDITRIQKVILEGILPPFMPRSWVIMPEGEYTSLVTPASFSTDVPDYNDILDLGIVNNSMNNVDFAGIKVGDVNDNCTDFTGTIVNDTEISGRSTKEIFLSNTSIPIGEEVLIPVYISSFNNQAVFSLGFQFDNEAVEILDVINENLPEFNEDSYTINFDREGAIDILWFNMQQDGVSIEPEIPAFSIKMRANQDIHDLRGLVELRYERIENIIFNITGEVENFELSIEEPFTENNIDGRSSHESSNNNSTTVKSFPNPFTDELFLQIELDSPEKVRIEIADINGKVLHTIEKLLNQGSNKVSVSLNSLNTIADGYLTYRVITSKDVIGGTLLKAEK